MAIPFKKYAWGDLNPIQLPDSADRIDSGTDDWLSSASVVHTKAFQSDVFQGTGPYLGVVLRVEQGAATPNSFATIGESNTEIRVEIKVRIPEVHAPLIEPNDSEDHFAIDMHPTFTAKDNNVPEPKIGELVWVDYQNKQTWAGPLYLGPIIAPPLPTGTKDRLSARQKGEICIDGCLQPANRRSSKIDTSTFPIAKGSLVPTKDNNRCLIFGDSQIAGHLGKTMQAYLQGSGWKVKRVDRSGSKIGPWLKGDAPECKKQPLSDMKLWGCIEKYIKDRKPALIFISMGGNHKQPASVTQAGPDIAALIKKIRKAAGWTAGSTSGQIIVAGCPPIVPGGRFTGEDKHQIDNPADYAYRKTVNDNMARSIRTLSSNKLKWIDPIKQWQKYLPKYMKRKTEHDGIHIDPAGAIEYVKNIAVSFGATMKANTPPPGDEGKEAAAGSTDPGANADANDAKENLYALVSGLTTLWKNGGKMFNKLSKAAATTELSKLQQARTATQEEIVKAPTPELKKKLEQINKSIDVITEKIKNWPKSEECRPCKVYKYRPLPGILNGAMPEAPSGGGPPVGFMNTKSGLTKKSPLLKKENLQFLSFIAAKCADGTSTQKFAPEAEMQQKMAEEAGIAFHTWGWVYATEHEKARREGLAHGRTAKKLGSKCHWVNAEKHWAGTEGQPYYEDPRGRLAEYLQAFREVAPGIPLANCCLTSWSQPALKPVQSEINRMFDITAPMCYSSGAADGGLSTQRKKWMRLWEAAQQAGRPFAPTCGTGRLDPKTGNYVGNLEDMLKLQKELPADWICFFNGVPSSAITLTESNQLNMSIIDFIKKLST